MATTRTKQAKISQINLFHVSLFAYLVEKLATTPEADGMLLDNCMLVYGSGIGDGNRHNHDNLPIVLVGSRRRHNRRWTSSGLPPGNALDQPVRVNARTHGCTGRISRRQHRAAARPASGIGILPVVLP